MQPSSVINFDDVPHYVPDSVLTYYLKVSQNPYIQAVLPGYTPTFRRFSKYSPSPTPGAVLDRERAQTDLERAQTDRERAHAALAEVAHACCNVEQGTRSEGRGRGDEGEGPLTYDREQSARCYWRAVVANVPKASTITRLSRDCNTSYGNNVFAMLFAFSASISGSYGETAHRSMFAQAIAIHQATSYVDVLGYVGIATQERDRVAWFTAFYWIIFRIFEIVLSHTTHNTILLYVVAIVLDLLHHGLHAAATLITFGTRGKVRVVWYKLCYHASHWFALLVSLPAIATTRDYLWVRFACWCWSTSHDYELSSHLANTACCSIHV